MKNDEAMPKQSVMNGLFVDAIPEALSGLNPVEKSMIALNIIFMKINKKPKSRMLQMTDRVVLVPVEPGDIMNSIETLPRAYEDTATCEVEFKRKKEMKNNHLTGFVRPAKVFKALAALKQLGHHGYQAVILKCLFCQKEFDDEDKEIMVHVENCSLRAQDCEEINQAESTDHTKKTDIPAESSDESSVSDSDEEMNTSLPENLAYIKASITGSALTKMKSGLRPKVKEILESFTPENVRNVTYGKKLHREMTKRPDEANFYNFKFFETSNNFYDDENRNKIVKNITFAEEIFEENIFEPIFDETSEDMQNSEVLYDDIFQRVVHMVEPLVFDKENYEEHKKSVLIEGVTCEGQSTFEKEIESAVRSSLQNQFESWCFEAMKRTYQSRLNHYYYTSLKAASDGFLERFKNSDGLLEIALNK